MALVGASVALTFAGSLVLAPALYPAIGVRGLFAMTGFLVVASIGVLLWVVPRVPRTVEENTDQVRTAVLLDRELLRLNVGIFVLHTVLMAMFVVLPVLLLKADLPLPEHWKIYFPVVLLSFALMAKPLLVAERRALMRPLFIGSIVLVLAAQLGFLLARRLAGVAGGVAADLLYRLQYPGSVPSVARVAHCAAICKRSCAGHLQYVAGAGPVCGWRSRRRDCRSLGS